MYKTDIVSKRFFVGLSWAILLSAIIYFSYGTVYHIGYRNGQASVKCTTAQCTDHIVKAEVACYKKVGWYK